MMLIINNKKISFSQGETEINNINWKKLVLIMFLNVLVKINSKKN